MRRPFRGVLPPTPRDVLRLALPSGIRATVGPSLAARPPPCSSSCCSASALLFVRPAPSFLRNSTPVGSRKSRANSRSTGSVVVTGTPPSLHAPLPAKETVEDMNHARLKWFGLLPRKPNGGAIARCRGSERQGQWQALLKGDTNKEIGFVAILMHGVEPLFHAKAGLRN